MIVFQLNVILIYIVPVKFDWQRIRGCKVSRRKFEAIDLFLRSILTEFHTKQIRELGWQSHLIKQRMCGFWIRTTLSGMKKFRSLVTIELNNENVKLNFYFTRLSICFSSWSLGSDFTTIYFLNETALSYDTLKARPSCKTGGFG